MRKEALLEQWKQLYETIARIKELEPWEELWDMDLIAVRSGVKEDTVFYSISSRGGDCYGIAVYEGYEGLNSFPILPMQQSMNLKPEYVMFSQKSLICYWGNCEELAGKQRKLIKDLGYSYRSKNRWLYFLSFEPGYYPYNMDESEMLWVGTHLQGLELALRYYNETDIKVNFEHRNMFLFSFGKDKRTWNFGEAPLPFTSFQSGNLLITDEELFSDLAKAPKYDAILEVGVSVLGVSVADKKYEHPGDSASSLMGDVSTGIIIKFEMLKPDGDPIVTSAEILAGFIFQFGPPKEIRASNIIVETGLEQIYDVHKIKLRRVKRLRGLDEFMLGM